jgi:hypothetical protein
VTDLERAAVESGRALVALNTLNHVLAAIDLDGVRLRDRRGELPNLEKYVEFLIEDVFAKAKALKAVMGEKAA